MTDRPAVTVTWSWVLAALVAVVALLLGITIAASGGLLLGPALAVGGAWGLWRCDRAL